MKKRIIALTLTLSVLVSAIFISAVNPLAIEETDVTVPSTIFAGGGFDSEDDCGLWRIGNAQDRTVAFDSETGHDNKGSVSINMPTAYYSPARPLQMIGKTIDGAKDSIDTEGNYKAEMYIKTSEDFCGSVYIRLRQGSAYITDGTKTDLVLLGSLTEGGRAFTDWTKLSSPTVRLSQQDVTIVVYVNGTGKVWIDDINIKKDNNLVLNGGFDANLDNWNNWGSQGDGDYIELTTEETCASAGALMIKVEDGLNHMPYMASAGISNIDTTKQYTLSMDVKCENVPLGGAQVRLFQHYDDENGVDQVTWLKCYGAETALTTGGTTDWQHFEVKLTGWVKGFKWFHVMLYLQGSGTVYYDNISITEREKISVAAGEIGADPESGEVEPMTSVSLVSSDDSSDIYYTLDGTDPATSPTAYLYNNDRGILVSEDMNIKACAVGEENSVGEVFEFNYTCTKGKVEDDVLWDVVNRASQISLDTTDKKVGKNSIKIQGAGAEPYISTGDMSIDGAFDYKLEFWVKTENLMEAENAFVNVFMTGSGSMQNEIDGRSGAYVKTTNIIEGIKETQDWTHYELIIDDLDEFWPTLNITAGLFNESGTFWIDGVSLTALPYEYYPIVASGDGAVHGNNYYKENLYGNFSLEQSFVLTNNTNNIESGILTYSVYNDKDMENAIGGGDENISVFPHSQSVSSANLTMCASYGTYTVKFEITNDRGYTYPAGSIKVAVIRDVSEQQEDSILGVCTPSTTLSSLYKQSGINVVRGDFHWKNAQPDEAYGDLVVQQVFDEWVEKFSANDVDILMILGDGSGPNWFKPGDANRFPKTDEEIDQFIDYVKKTVEYFKGKVKYYELYNEANWLGFTVTGEEYAKLLKAFYKAVKEVDPSAYVVAGATSLVDLNWSTKVFESLGKEEVYMDYWSCHPYANPKSPEDRDWVQSIESLEEALIRYTGREVPLLLDELGWSDNESGGGVNQQEQLKWYVRTVAYADSLDYVEKVFIFNSENGASGNKYVQELRWGMFGGYYATNAYARPFVAGLTNYVYMTDGYEFASSEKLADGLYVFKYTGANKNKDLYMIWTNDVDLTAKITTTATAGRVYDIFGNMLSLSFDGNTLTTDVSGEAIYLTLDKGEKINSIVLLNRDGSEINKTPDDNQDDNENKGTTAGNSTAVNNGENSYNNVENTANEETTTTEKQLVRKKKIVKKVVSGGGEDDTFNYLPIIIGISAAVVAVGIGVFLIVFFKKRKKKAL